MRYRFKDIIPVSELEKNAEKMIKKIKTVNNTLKGMSLTRGYLYDL